jgi:hypothetical protein
VAPHLASDASRPTLHAFNILPNETLAATNGHTFAAFDLRDGLPAEFVDHVTPDTEHDTVTTIPRYAATVRFDTVKHVTAAKVFAVSVPLPDTAPSMPVRVTCTLYDRDGGILGVTLAMVDDGTNYPNWRRVVADVAGYISTSGDRAPLPAVSYDAANLAKFLAPVAKASRSGEGYLQLHFTKVDAPLRAAVVRYTNEPKCLGMLMPVRMGGIGDAGYIETVVPSCFVEGR